MIAINQFGRNIHTVEMEGSEINTLQISDVHFDSHKCDRELLTKHLREAEKRGAFVMINGDWFDLMGGKYDPRSTYDMIRPEYKGANYLDLVIQDAAEYLSKFNLTYFIGRGNHETNITKRLHTDPIDRLVMLLKTKGITCEAGGYSGWIIYRLQYQGRCKVFTQHYHHGFGGNAPRSKGILNADINMKRFPDAQIITRGHDHNKWYLPQSRIRLHSIRGNNFNYEQRDEIVHILQTGSYKMLGDGFGGWAVEKGFDRPVLGGWWLSFHHFNKQWQVKIVDAS